jgi:hypothetical protein
MTAFGLLDLEGDRFQKTLDSFQILIDEVNSRIKEMST